MVGEYPVFQSNHCVGKATIQRNGLYYVIRAYCTLPKNPHRMQVRWEDKTLDLGLFVPNGKQYNLHKTIAVKQAGVGEPHFNAVEHDIQDKHKNKTEMEDVVDLESITSMRLVIIEGKACLQIDG